MSDSMMKKENNSALKKGVGGLIDALYSNFWIDLSVMRDTLEGTQREPAYQYAPIHTNINSNIRRNS